MVRVRHIWPALLLIAAATARSSPGETYWISYDPSSGLFPEQDGWTRRIAPEGGALRYFEDGDLVIDSRASIMIVDYCDMFRTGHLDPAPGEVFVMRWRLKMDEVVGRYDVSLGVASDQNWQVGFEFGYATLYSAYHPGLSAPFAPGVFHDYELRSSDMRAYTLTIDGIPAINDTFWQGLQTSRVGWGDGVQGGASLSHWASFEFGVLPEPTTAPVLGLAVVFLRCRRTRTQPVTITPEVTNAHENHNRGCGRAGD